MVSKTLACDVPLEQLKTLLHDLAFLGTGTTIRLKVIGEAWPEHFSEVLVFTDHAIVLAHMPSRTVFHVSALSRISAFEIDKPHLDFSAHTPYTVNNSILTVKAPSDGLLHA